MKTFISKKTYIEPQVELIILDHEISLTLDSFVPPDGPGEGSIGSLAPDYFNDNPFKNNLG